MIIDFEKINIYVRPGRTDMRKQINGLSIIAEAEMEQDIFTGNLFLFCNRSRRILKGLYWDRNGFWLMQKKLEKDKFPWPDSEEQAREIDFYELKMLLDGIDFWKAHKSLEYASVS
jgi:transposase